MMPKTCFTGILFPYTADVFYADLDQDSWGAMESTWTFNRTIKCYVVNVYEDSSNDRPMLLETQRRFQLWDEGYVVRTKDNVLYDGAAWHTPQQTLLSNIKTSDDAEHWTSFVTGAPLNLEVRGIMPILDPFEKLHHYKINAQVSNDQVADGV